MNAAQQQQQQQQQGSWGRDRRRCELDLAFINKRRTSSLKTRYHWQSYNNKNTWNSAKFTGATVYPGGVYSIQNPRRTQKIYIFPYVYTP